MKEYMNSNNNNIDKDKKMVIVIGPEGGNYYHQIHYCPIISLSYPGWNLQEVQTFIDNGYNLINIGDRILRTDMAVPALLGLAHEHIAL